MANSPRLMPRLFALLVALCLSGAVHLRAAASPPDMPASYALTAENDTFQLYVDSETLAFKLLDKRSGYLWQSGLDEAQDGDKLNKSWKAFALSGLSIEYLDEKAANKRVSISNSPHTLEVTPIEQGISAVVHFDDFGITIGLKLQLEADGVRVELPFDAIHEDDPAFRLALVYVYPFLGAARGSSEPGYMFMPDGIGSIVRFGDTTKAQDMFYGRYYGDDLGMTTYMPFSPRVRPPIPISFPVFGMVHGEGENAFLSVIEEGASYAELQAHPAGILTNFNFQYNAFIYNQTYFQATNRSGAGVTAIQRQPNQYNAIVHYRFLTGDAANYTGMALSYQQYLLDKGLLHRTDDPNPNIGIRLEFLGGDKERVLLWNRFVSMTTLAQMRDILAALNIPNPEVIYYGWQSFGAYTVTPPGLALEGALGNVDELRDLAAQVTAAGGHFSLFADPQAALWGEEGYSTRNDIVMSITNRGIEGYGRSYNYYFSLNPLRERFTALVNEVAARTPAGLALDSIGGMLFSDFRASDRLSREETIRAYQSLLAAVPLRLGLYRPNDYLFGVTQAYYDMPLSDNGYVYTTQAVPFLPIVLAGYIPYYGNALNFSSDQREDALRQVEYGIYPSYFLTHEPTASMLNTPSSWIYTSSYDQWGDPIRSTYAWMNALLAPVRGQTIAAHEQLAAGVFATTYAGGQQIIVNYTDQPFVRGSVTVAPQDALLVEDAS